MDSTKQGNNGRFTYSVREVAEMVGVDIKTIRRAMVRGQIPYVEIGRISRIPTSVVNRMLHIEEES